MRRGGSRPGGLEAGCIYAFGAGRRSERAGGEAAAWRFWDGGPGRVFSRE